MSEAAAGPQADGADHELTVAAQRVPIADDVAAPPTMFRRWLYLVVAAFLVAASKTFFRMRIEGIENVPRDEPFILAPVHRSNIDFALIVACGGVRMPRLRYLAKDTLWRGAWGRLWTALGAIPVHRGTPDRISLAACIDVLEAGEPLVMFPEGTRQSGPIVQELFDGPAYVQARTGAPIVPVGIGGSQAAMPKGAKLIRPHRIVLTVGVPLVVPERNERGRVPRRVVREQTELLHEELQVLFDAARDAAGD